MVFNFNKKKFFLTGYRLLKVLIYRLRFNAIVYQKLRKLNLSYVLDMNKRYRLVVCHNGGGGTAAYLSNKYGKVKDVLLLKKIVSADKDYLYLLQNMETGQKVKIIPEQLSNLNNFIKEINIVSVDSFMSLNFIFNWFISLCVPISYDVHDYHCIWYDSHLIRDGKYLLKDDIEASKFNYLFFTITFEQYHEMWKNLFSKVDKINVFSKSSKLLIIDYFPEIKDKINLKPHSLEYINCGKLKHISKKFTVGIFGSILGEDKGCKVVQSFLNYSKNKGYDVFINGELRSDCMITAPNIHYMGRYNVSLLDKIIEEQHISVVLFPSICPETFSYTVAELIYVGIPVVCFNIGAQAEKISAYKYGEIINDRTNETIYVGLQKAFNKSNNY